GVLNKNAGEFASRKVSEVKPLIVKELQNKGLTDFLYELPEKVICRCTTECTVKILEDQWFLKYSDPDWKNEAHECVDRASIYPDSARQWFHDVIDWIRDWPCARKVGLGTPLPWSPGWIVETLSDSTIYTAFYTIRSKIKEYSVGDEALTDDFFDYVLLGEGNENEISMKSGIPSERIKEMRNEFLYWYPVDLRNSAKELIPNHLMFYVFQHVAFFPKAQWPRGISANGMMMNEGVKMSKSKGNVITLAHALDQYGADVLRAALISGAEGMDDIDWRERSVKDIQAKINSLANFVSSLLGGAAEPGEYAEPELLLESRIQRRVSDVVQFLEVMKTKSAFQEAFYNYWNDVRYYLGRTEVPSKQLLEYTIDTWIRLLSPFIPYTCEEISSQMGHTALISTSPYPIPDLSKLHPEAELAEMSVQRLISDAQNIMRVISQKVSSIHLYLAPEWSYRLLDQAIVIRDGRNKTRDILQAFFDANPDVPRREVADMLPKITKTINELGDDFVKTYAEAANKLDEEKTYSCAINYLEEELSAGVVIHPNDEPSKFDPKQRAKLALPLKPALYLE
ncbi:MAG: class I tRNA ligase family protein, partial [Nitrososphaerales archaeon]